MPAGQRVNLDLPDGSNVWLNAGTTMKYPVSFMKGKREVMLDGDVKTNNGEMLSVKTAEAIPFEKMRDAMKALSAVTVKTPVHIGDVILADVCGTGVSVVATKNIG